MQNDPAAPTDEPHAEAEAMLRKHAAMYDWSKAEAKAINDFILTVRFGVQEELYPAAAPAAEGPRHEVYGTPSLAEARARGLVVTAAAEGVRACTQIVVRADSPEHCGEPIPCTYHPAATSNAVGIEHAGYIQTRPLTNDELDSAARKAVETLSGERRADGLAGLLAEVRKRWWKLVSPAAALPCGEAEASATAFPDDAEWLVYLDRFVEQTNPQSLPRSVHDRLRAVAALASEVRALTDRAELAEGAVAGLMKPHTNHDYGHHPESCGRCAAQAVADGLALAARLASPSPTGAE